MVTRWGQVWRSVVGTSSTSRGMLAGVLLVVKAFIVYHSVGELFSLYVCVMGGGEGWQIV